MPPLRPVRSRLVALAWVGALSLLLARGAAAEDPPVVLPPEPPPLALTRVETDAHGTLEALLRAAEEARAARAWGRLSENLVAVVRGGADVPVALPVGDREREALRWPAARVVERLAAELPLELRSGLARQLFGGSLELDAERARDGDSDALARLARPPVLLAVGEEALLAEGERALERGAPDLACTFFRRWLDLHVVRPDPRQVEVALRLVSALARTGDEAGLLALAQAPPPEPPATGGVPGPSRVAAEAVRRLARLVAAARPPTERDAPRLPTRLVRAWVRDLADPGLRGATEPRTLVTEGLWAEPELVLVHAGRRVSCLEPLTGEERWSFPSGPLGWDHDPTVKYVRHDLPLRSVERHGSRVLAVLGDPGGSGSFKLEDTAVDLDGGTRESRARLVALDVESGALLWHTGALGESHPVLGDRATCCASPPLVVGEDVYVLFARRFGVVDLYAACLELATGRPKWVRFLGAAESGRDVGAEILGGREDFPPVRAVPWGQRPALAQGELCVVPHAGFAAGLRADTGSISWLRALPRFPALLSAIDRERGASARNEPVALPGGWALAPMDAPVVLALERGSGRLRWQTSTPVEDQDPPWRDLLGLARDLRGRPVLRLVGTGPAHLDPFTGGLPERGTPLSLEWEGDLPLAVRPLDLGAGVAAVHEGRLIARSWPDRPEPTPDAVLLEAREGAGPGLGDADVARAGPVWLTLEPGRLSAWVDPAEAEALLGTTARERVSDPTERAALEATAAVVFDDPTLLGAAFEGLQDGAPVPRSLAAGLCRCLEAGPESAGALLLLRRVLPQLERLPAPERDRAFALGSWLLRRPEHVAERVGLLSRWVDAPPGWLSAALPWVVERRDVLPSELRTSGASALDDEPRVRGDLVAALTLRGLRAIHEARAALAAREEVAAARLEAALAGADAAALREALRRAVGTRALTAAREKLVERALAEGEPGRAARLAADLRLDPPERAPEEESEALAWAARWQLSEAGWLAEAGDPEAALSLLEDLRRWVPSGTQDARGRTTTALLEELRAAYGWSPRRGHDARAPLALAPTDSTRPASRDDRAAAIVPGIFGPGAWGAGRRLLVLRGLSLEIWDPLAGERLATLDAGDQGWFGGTLQDGASWLPERGVRVVSAVAGEPGDRAGVRAGDWIVQWDGQAVGGAAELMRKIASSTPGEPVSLSVLRAGEPLRLELKPGRRSPGGSAGILWRDRLWSDARGRLLVPTRIGLSRLDVAEGRLESLWRWDGSGTVQRVEVRAGLAVALIRRLHDADALVGLDARDGKELWRTDVEGSVLDVDASGSALIVTAEAPARVLVLGAEDGQLRAELPRRATRRARYPTVLPLPLTAEAAAGRLYVLGRADAGTSLTVVNTTTARAAFAPVDPPRRPLSSDVEPSLSAGAYVALILSPTLIRVHEPDPLTEGFRRSLRLTGADLLTEEMHHGGELDSESRIVSRGNTLYVLRYQRRREGSQGRGATVMVFGRIESDDRLRFTVLDHEPPASHASAELYVTHLEAHPDGLLVAARTQTPDARSEYLQSVLWAPSAEGGGEGRSGSPPIWEDSVTNPRLGGPARVGPYLVLTVDDGARLVPVVPLSEK